MASRTFGNNDIKALSSRIRSAQEVGASGIKKVESARSDIESAIAEAIRPEWMRVLRTIPVDELNANKDGIRTNLLKEAGYNDIYSVHAASEQSLASINGIGEVMSLRAKQNAAKIAVDVNNNVKLKISLDHKSDEYSRLVTAVAEYMRARENQPRCEQLLSMLPPDTMGDLEKLNCAKSGIKWMFTGNAKKEEAQAAYERLTACIAAIDRSGLIPQIQGQVPVPGNFSGISGPISIATAWSDFARRPIEYYQTLEEIAPERFDSDEDGYGLSDEIKEDVANTPVDLTGLNCTLRGYQLWGVKYILHQKRVLLGDEMGLGKTIQALAAMVSLRNDYLHAKEAPATEAVAPAQETASVPQQAPAATVSPLQDDAVSPAVPPAVSPLQDDSDLPSIAEVQHPPRFLVICPASVIVNWCREIEAKSDLTAYNLHDKDRDAFFRTWSEEGGVAVTNYESLENHFVISEDFDIDMIIVDEAHYIKNTEAKRSKNVLHLCDHTDRILFMTGTPLENNVNEMIRLMDYLQHDVAQRAQQVSMTAYADDFKDKISPVYYRRKRESVLSELPDLTDIKEWCDMTPEDERAYENDVLTGSFMDVRRVSWRNEDYLNTSAKVQRLREIVEDATEDGRKILVFSFFLDTLEKIRTIFGEKCVGVINGAVPVEERQNIVDAFEAAPPGSVLSAQIQSGGTGLNIQSASVVILCEPQYKPSTENQAIGRAHRMGQTRDVLVYRLLCPDTVDERMIEIIENKQAEFDTFADESTAANRDAESERNGVDVNQNVIVGMKEGIDAAAQPASGDSSAPAAGEDPTATRPAEQPVLAPSEGPTTEREIDNASINKIFADEKARILAKRQREAESGIAPAPVPQPAPAPAPQPAPAPAPIPAAPALKFCRFCGKQIAADSAFCNYCGKDIR
ncbi:MAG: RNA helicase [Clostridiales bacterium]|nr:RNA helicase [Clostridiales bacterium]